MAEQEDEAGKEGEAPAKSKKKLFIILGLVLLLVGAGVPAAFLMMGGEPPAEVEEEFVEDEIRLASFEFDPIVVNLTKSSSFLKATIVVEYDAAMIEPTGTTAEGGGAGYGGGAGNVSGVTGDVPTVLEGRVHHMKDAIISILSGKTAEEVLSLEGKERLKDELVEALNDATGLDEGPVVAVYFLEFIVQ